MTPNVTNQPMLAHEANTPSSNRRRTASGRSFSSAYQKAMVITVIYVAQRNERTAAPNLAGT